MTKVSAYWGELLKLGERNAAMDFLVRLNRNVPESYVPEIAGMITETAASQARREKAGPPLQKGAGRRVVTTDCRHQPEASNHFVFAVSFSGSSMLECLTIGFPSHCSG